MRKWALPVEPGNVLGGLVETEGEIIKDMFLDVFTKPRLHSQNNHKPKWEYGDALFRLICNLKGGD